MANAVPLPLLDAAGLRALEAQAKAGLPPGTLMQRAGQSAARLAWRTLFSGHVRPRAAVLAGPGDNGGDAFVAALALHMCGVQVHVYADNTQTPDAQHARAQCGQHMPIVPLQDFLQAAPAHGVIDGLLGIGANRAPQAAIAAVITHANAQRSQGTRILALDVPSGLNAWTGQPWDVQATVQADYTHTFLSMKPGLYTGEGQNFCGQVSLDTLGVEAPRSTRFLTQPGDFTAHFSPRRPAQHKGHSGDVAVLGGASGMQGAALLAARAALATGVGRLYVCLQDQALTADPLYPEAMLRTWQTVPAHCSAIAAGCGMGQSDAALQALAQVIAADSTLVLDADALNLMAAQPALMQAVMQRATPTIITPHPLEAARLLNTTAAQVQADRMAAVHALAQRCNAVAVLKGAGTLIATPRGRCALNPTGNTALATGGTGDMLAGAIAALLASRMQPFEAAMAAVYAHGLAAQCLRMRQLGGTAGLHSVEFVQALAQVMNALRAHNTGITHESLVYRF
jgi:ADP-dependent NAD(P)H-hydrate dehydratase / NAD(P)H-hydrate epimerase